MIPPNVPRLIVKPGNVFPSMAKRVSTLLTKLRVLTQRADQIIQNRGLSREGGKREIQKGARKTEAEASEVGCE